MLGVHIIPMLDFREHFTFITKAVKRLAKTLAKRKLSPSLKSLAVEQLLDGAVLHPRVDDADSRGTRHVS